MNDDDSNNNNNDNNKSSGLSCYRFIFAAEWRLSKYM